MPDFTHLIFWLFPAGMLLAAIAHLPDLRAAWFGRRPAEDPPTLSFLLGILFALGFVAFALRGQFPALFGWVSGAVALLLAAFLATWCLRPTARESD